jgi:outer membrane lipoprotein-sorting protein
MDLSAPSWIEPAIISPPCRASPAISCRLVQTVAGRWEKFYLQNPGRVRFQYEPPSPIEFIADGYSFVVRDRNLATHDLYPLSQTPLRYLLADQIDLARDTKVAAVSQDNNIISVTIEERQLLVVTSRLVLMFSSKDMWTVTDLQGSQTMVAVYNLDTSHKPDPGLFTIK